MERIRSELAEAAHNVLDPSHDSPNEWIVPKTVKRVARFGRSETHITEDGEGLGQSFAQQADPFCKQLVQMLPEVLSIKSNA